jgi:hypothetical protein
VSWWTNMDRNEMTLTTRKPMSCISLLRNPWRDLEDARQIGLSTKRLFSGLLLKNSRNWTYTYRNVTIIFLTVCVMVKLFLCLVHLGLCVFHFYIACVLKLKITYDISEIFRVYRGKYLDQERTWHKHARVVVVADVSVWLIYFPGWF